MKQQVLDRLLSSGVENPARYIGGEWNSIVKESARLRFALCFPDVYEIGMSHLGSRILYHVLNARDGIACERVFAPWTDMEARLKEENLPLFSLETKRGLNSFDVIGFSLLYEMCYTNILTMLSLAGIPYRSADRGEDAPLVVCGGPCACNPEPIADFMDAVMIGDGEEMIVELADAVLASREAGETKKELLLRISRIPGVYVPSFYEPQYEADGMYAGLNKLAPAAPDTITRRVVMDLDGAAYLGKPIVPYLNIVHDRLSLELFRGCTRGCRFCQAGYIYRPVREKKKDTLMAQARELLDCTGYDEISLLSLSSSDYSAIHELVPELLDSMQARRVSVSLPSLRVDKFIREDLERMQEVRKGGLTFAPEAGTQRLRDIINKGVTEDDLMRAMGDAFEAGWSGVKLYFMIGLPGETDEDVVGIADLARKVSRLYYSIPKESRGKGLRLTISASSFVPKPFTPFQWEPQNTMEELKRKQQLLKQAMKGIRGAEFHYHTSDLSVLEAAFSRGDRRLSSVLEAAHALGCRFDSWDEHFRPQAWKEAFAACGLDPAFYAHRSRTTNERLPWEHVNMLVSTEYLQNELNKAMSGIITKDCREGCNGCFGEEYANYCKLR